MCRDGLGDASDLVDLEEEAVAGLVLHGHLDALRVGHGQVVAHDLDVGGSGQSGPAFPVVLFEQVILIRFCMKVLLNK